MTRIIRLYTDHDLNPDQTIPLSQQQAHYLRNVLRRDQGDQVSFFNGRDGSWIGEITSLSKKDGTAIVTKCIAPQKPQADLWVVCPPIKKDRYDFCLEKSVELGASDFMPVYTDFTDIKRANIDRLSLHAIDAAQQCEATTVLTVHPPRDLGQFLDSFPKDRILYFCAERGKAPAFADILKTQPQEKTAILVGPEGGFSETELEMLNAHPQAKGVHLGDLILRTETALTAALTLYQALQGQWVDCDRSNN